MAHPSRIVPAHRLRAQAAATTAAKPKRGRKAKAGAAPPRALVDRLRDGDDQ